MSTEFKKFTIEGEAVLGFFASEMHSHHVRIKTDAEGPESDGERVEQVIARSMGFPSDAEFDEMFQRNEQLRNQGLQPADGTADVVRRGKRIRITVELVEGDDD